METSQHTRKYDELLAVLRRARKRAGLTQLEVAARLDTYVSYVSKCESGERRMDVVESAQFCKLYGVSLVEVLRSAGIE